VPGKIFPRQLLNRWRQRQRGHYPDRFAVDLKAFPAGGQDVKGWATMGQRLNQPGHRFNEVFAIVQQEQEPPVAQVIHQRIERRAICVLDEA